MQRHRIIGLIVAASLLAVAPASAKDLRGRFALGFNNQFGPLTSASLKFTLPARQPTVNVQLQLVAGMALFKARSYDDEYFGGLRMLFTFIAEDNLNVYAGGGAGYAGFSDATNAVRVQPVMGVEFFLFGLENLGFSGEFGVNVDIGVGATSGLDVSSTAGSFGAVGVHYYF